MAIRYSIALVIAILGAGAELHARQWIEGSILGFNPDNSKAPLAIYQAREIPGADTFGIPKVLAPDRWHRVTLPSAIPDDVRAVFLSGLLIITHPSDAFGVRLPIICNLTAAFRAPGSTWNPGNYQLQTASTPTQDGPRTNAATWVPVRARQFEFYYTSTPSCPTIINLSLQAYVR